MDGTKIEAMPTDIPLYGAIRVSKFPGAYREVAQSIAELCGEGISDIGQINQALRVWFPE